jgi:hypothetical protein
MVSETRLGGFEPPTRGLEVRLERPQRIAFDGKCLQNGSQGLKRVTTKYDLSKQARTRTVRAQHVLSEHERPPRGTVESGVSWFAVARQRRASRRPLSVWGGV